MNLSTVYCRTSKGARALSLKNKVLPPSHIQVLTKTDSKLDAKSVMQAIGKLTEYQYTQILIQLINDGFIIAKSDFDETAFFASNTINPMVVEELQTKQFFDTSFGSAITRSASPTPVATLHKSNQKQDGKARAQAELDEEAENIAQVQAAIETKLRLEAEAQAKAEAEAKAKAEAEVKARAQAKAEAEAKAKAEAEAKAKAEAEVKARAQAKAEAEVKARAQAKAEAEAKAKAEAEAEAQAKAEAEAKARAEAEAQAKAEIEAVLQKHQQKKAASSKSTPPEPTPLKVKQHIDIDEEAFGDTFAPGAYDDYRHVSADAFDTIASANPAPKVPKFKLPSFNFSLLKAFSFGLHYTVTFVTQWLVPAGLTIAGLVLVLALLTYLPIVVSPWLSNVEQLASNHIGERVKIHQMHTALLPSPHLVLEHIDVGNVSDVQVQSAKIFPTWAMLTTDARPIEKIELKGMLITPAQAKRSAQWLMHGQSKMQWQTQQFELRDITIQLAQSKLPSFDASLQFNPSGQLSHAEIMLDEQRTQIVLTAQANDYAITMQAKKTDITNGCTDRY